MKLEYKNIHRIHSQSRDVHQRFHTITHAYTKNLSKPNSASRNLLQINRRNTNLAQTNKRKETNSENLDSFPKMNDKCHKKNSIKLN